MIIYRSTCPSIRKWPPNFVGRRSIKWDTIAPSLILLVDLNLINSRNIYISGYDRESIEILVHFIPVVDTTAKHLWFKNGETNI